MDPLERSALVDYLDHSRKQYLAAFEGSENHTHRHKPSPEVWSLLECAEHVAMVEDLFHKRISTSPQTGESSKNADLEHRVRTQGVDRTKRYTAPPQVHPTGDRFETLEEALAHFNTTRDRLIEFLQECEDPRRLTGAHPLFGPMNGVELILFAGSHALRHADQVREIRSKGE